MCELCTLELPACIGVGLVYLEVVLPCSSLHKASMSCFKICCMLGALNTWS